MKHEIDLRHKFVEYLPKQLEDGVVYVSIGFATAAHKCACGCGKEVVTPITPTDWQITYDGETICLYPSIGNWNFPCQSHYWIRHNRVRWARHWSAQEIADGRAYDRRRKDHYYDRQQPAPIRSSPADRQPERGLWRAIRDWFLQNEKA